MLFYSKSLLLWGVIYTFLVDEYAGEYVYLYGGVVAQIIENATMNNPDVTEAVKLAGGKIGTHSNYSVTNIEKQRLYFSLDNVSPFLHEYESISHISGRQHIQQKQLVVGLMYLFVLSYNNSLNTETVESHFAVSRDRNKKYHIFKHTTQFLSALQNQRKLSQEVSVCRTQISLPLKFLHPISFNVPSLRIASYNIWNVNSIDTEGESYESRLSRLSKFISSLDADIFGFQEVRLEVSSTNSRSSSRTRTPSPTQSQISQLSSQLPGYHFVYQPAMLYMERLLERKEEGLAIFSRYPILSSDYRLLYRNNSDSEDYHQRICLHAELFDPKFGPVHVFVSHLSLSKDSQERSVVEIWNYMEEFSGIKLLMGDLNTEPHSNTIRFLTGEVPLEGIYATNLHDTWKVTNTENPSGLTFSALEDVPVKRIDYIFASLAYSSGVHIAASEVVHDGNICFLPCSDHYAILTVLNSTI